MTAEVECSRAQQELKKRTRVAGDERRGEFECFVTTKIRSLLTQITKRSNNFISSFGGLKQNMTTMRSCKKFRDL